MDVIVFILVIGIAYIIVSKWIKLEKRLKRAINRKAEELYTKHRQSKERRLEEMSQSDKRTKL
ncbi:hypothetical protein [Streptococcus ovuberis]|uniref:Uncharacterized protein n=1 Tax=Streptococcus ovuberis TaxID=1936207 RepID=A0A7X6MX38_9STRE|nr:hypothetical protein [Streptococcus ovuberis]NKZ19980.1 hypothetical protein [Streptococcus ovuberis]